jgi:hypothetical protein
MSLLLVSRNLHTKNTVSYNDRFSSAVLAAICSSAFVLFYSVSYLLRPVRVARLAHTYFIKHEASTLLTLAFANVRRKRAVSKILERGAETVLVPQQFRIRNKAS